MKKNSSRQRQPKAKCNCDEKVKALFTRVRVLEDKCNGLMTAEDKKAYGTFMMERMRKSYR